MGGGVGLLMAALCLGSARAQTSGAWTNNTGNGNWTNNANWNPTSFATGGTAIAYLTNDIAANRIITNDVQITLGQLWLGDASGTSTFTLTNTSGGSFVFDNGATSAVINKFRGGTDAIFGNLTLNSNLIISNLVGSAGSLTINGTVSGVNKSLTKEGPGWVILNATNTYTGQTVLNGGVLRIMDSRWIDTSSNLLFNGGVLEIVSNDFSRAGGLGTGSNQLQIVGGASGFSANGSAARKVTIGAGGTLLQWGTNLFNPSVLVLQYTNANQNLTFDNALDFNGTNRTIDVQGNIAFLTRSVTNKLAGSAAGLIKTGIGTLALQAYNGWDGPTVVNNGALRIQYSTSAVPTNNAFILNGGQVEFYADGTFYQNPVLGYGAGKLTMTNNAGFSAAYGQRTVTVNENGGNTLVWGAGDLVGFGQLLLQNSISSVNNSLLWLNNNLDFNGASRTVNVQGALAVIGGTVTNSGAAGASLVKTGSGTLVVLGNNYVEDGATLLAAGTLELGDYWGHAGALPGLAGNAGNLTNNGALLIANPGDMTLSGNIVGTGTLTKNNRFGTLTLTGTNAYTGSTTVNRGTLALDFSAAGAPATNIIGTGNAPSALTLGGGSLDGGTLSLTGAPGVANYQVFKSLTVGQGVSAINAQSGAGGTLTVLLSNITRSAGGVLDFTLPANGTLRAANTNIFGILSGALTVGGTDWAASNSASGGYAVISNYTGYTIVGEGGTMADGSNQNIRLTGNAGLAAVPTAINTLAVTNDGGNYTLALGGQTLRLGAVGGLLVPAGAGATTIGSSAGDGILTAGLTVNSAGELVLINNAANPLTINANITSNGTSNITLTKAGNGTVNFAGNIGNRGQTYVLAGAANFSGVNSLGGVNVSGGTLTFTASSSNNLGGSLVVNDATVNINGPLMLGGNEIQLGTANGARSILNITTNIVANRIRPAYNTDGGFTAGAIFQNGGTVNAQAGGNGFTMADGTLDYGYYSLVNGMATGDVVVAYRGYGIMDVGNGGVVATSNGLQLVNSSGTGILNVYAGGQVLAPSTGGALNGSGSAYQGGLAILNVLGGSVNAAYGNQTKALDLMAQAGNTFYLNLLGGVVTANVIKASNADGASILDFNGGTLAAAISTNNFIAGLKAAYVYAGGAFVDSGASNITISQNLLAPTGYGLAAIATNAACGGQYIAPPVVQITGGSGTGALALAEVDFATGSITNFHVVNPGTGYLAGDVLTVTLQGGGPLLTPAAFTVSGASLAANLSGGLTKLGTGTLTLSGTNTLGGSLAISNGTLAFGRSDLATIGNLVTGPGALAQAGSGTLVLTGPNNYTGPTLVQNGTLRAEFGAGLPSLSNLILTGGVWESASGLINTVLGAGAGQVQLPGGASGFSAYNTPLTVNLFGDSRTLVWGGTGSFNPASLTLNGASASTNLTFVNGLDLNGTTRNVNVNTVATSNLVGTAQATATAATLAGTIANSGAAGAGLTKNGFGTLLMTGTNTFDGNVTVNQGILQINNSAALGTGSKTIFIINGTAGNPQLLLDGAAGPIDLPSNIVFQTSNNGAAGGGSIVNLAGNNIVRGAITLVSGGGATALRSSAGKLTLTGNISANTAGRALLIGGNGVGQIDGVISDGAGAYGVTFDAGSGTWIFTTNNTYSGGTTLYAGTLIVTNDGTSAGLGSGTILVSSNGTLNLAGGALGTGAMTLNLAGMLNISSGVAGPGTLTINNNGVVNLAGGLITNGINTVSVGSSSGTAQLNISGGNFVMGTGTGTNNPFFNIGNSASGTGLVTVTGGKLNLLYAAGLDPTGPQLLVGSSGPGQLLVTGPTTTALVQQITVGSGGDGTLIVSNGAYMAQQHARFTAGGNPGTTGRVIVDNATLSVTANTWRFGSGARSTGILILTNNGLAVSTGGLQLGALSGGTPSFSYAGTGIVFQSSGTLSNYNQSLYFGATTNAVGVYNLSGGLYAGGNGAVTIGQFLGGQGTLNISGGVFDSTGATITLASATNTSGTINLSGGTLKVNQLALDTGTAPGNTATLNLSGGNLMLGAGGLTAGGGASSQTNLFLSGGTLGSLAAWSSALNMTLTNNPGPGTVAFDTTGGNISLSGALSGPGGLAKVGTGTLTLSGLNSFGGGTVVSNGLLRISGVSALPAFQDLSLVTSGATVDLGANPAFVNTLSGLGAITNGGGLTVQSGAFGGKLLGAGGLTKTGSGTFNLGGTNGYAGPTIVSNGTLLANTSLSGLISVYNGGTLGGTGALGTVQLNNGGTLSPGNGPGVQFVTSLTLSGGTLRSELVSSNNFDQVIANALTLTPGTTNFLHLALNGFTLEAGASYLIARNDSLTPWDGSSIFFLNDLSVDNGLALTNGMTFQAMGETTTTTLFRISYDYVGSGDGVANDILLTVIPEPASLNLLVICGAAFWLRRRLRAQRRPPLAHSH